jgi:hypothetical protein
MATTRSRVAACGSSPTPTCCSPSRRWLFETHCAILWEPELATGLHGWIYGSDRERGRFERWTEQVAALPRRQTRVLTWPIVTSSTDRRRRGRPTRACWTSPDASEAIRWTWAPRHDRRAVVHLDTGLRRIRVTPSGAMNQGRRPRSQCLPLLISRSHVAALSPSPSDMGRSPSFPDCGDDGHSARSIGDRSSACPKTVGLHAPVPEVRLRTLPFRRRHRARNFTLSTTYLEVQLTGSQLVRLRTTQGWTASHAEGDRSTPRIGTGLLDRHPSEPSVTPPSALAPSTELIISYAESPSRRRWWLPERPPIRKAQ